MYLLDNRERVMVPTHSSVRTAPLSHTSTSSSIANSHHHIPNPHAHITMAPPPQPNQRVIKTARTPTPTSYVGSTELLVPLRTDPLANGSLTTTSNGVAVVTINRTAGDMAGTII